MKRLIPLALLLLSVAGMMLLSSIVQGEYLGQRRKTDKVSTLIYALDSVGMVVRPESVHVSIYPNGTKSNTNPLWIPEYFARTAAFNLTSSSWIDSSKNVSETEPTFMFRDSVGDLIVADSNLAGLFSGLYSGVVKCYYHTATTKPTLFSFSFDLVDSSVNAERVRTTRSLPAVAPAALGGLPTAGTSQYQLALASGGLVDVNTKTGFTASPTAGSITSSSFAAGAIDAAAIATGAIGADELAAGAITSSEAPNLDASVLAVKTQTDKFAFTVTNKVDANVYTWNGTAVSTPAVAGQPVVTLGATQAAYTPATVAQIGTAGANLTALGDTRIANLNATVSSRSILTAADVWDLTSSGHTTAGTMGGKLHGDSINVAAVKLQTDKLTFTVANKIDANVYTWNGTAVATPATAGVPDVNMKNIANATVSTSTAQLGVNAVNVGGVVPGSATIGTVTTAVNLTNAPTVGSFTAAMIASITAAVPTIANIVAGILVTPANKLTTASGGYVTTGTNLDKSDYSLAGGGLTLDSTQTAKLNSIYGAVVDSTGFLSMLAAYFGAGHDWTQTLYPADGSPYKDSVVIRNAVSVRKGKIIFIHTNDPTVVDQITFQRF